MPFDLFIRNMVSNDCKKVVTQLLTEKGIQPLSVRLGEVILTDQLSDETINDLKESLNNFGYAIINDNKAEITVKVKLLLEAILEADTFDLKLKLSDYLADKMRYEYHYLSSLFSQMEETTIEQFFIHLKVGKIKELIVEDKLNLSQISYKFGYSSPAHLTNQFKKNTGMTPTEYKKSIQKNN
jgi:AraC family transcriptional regulator